MKKLSLYFIAGSILLATAAMHGCKKINSINNNTVVETPYSLYFSDTSGTLFSSTDGKNYSVIFPPDGKPCRSLITSAENILWSKDSLYYSTNNGVNFNQSFDSLVWLPGRTVNNVNINLNQSMLINTPTWGNRVYLANRAIAMNTSTGPLTNLMGLDYSDQNGELGTWNLENSYNKDSANYGGVGILPVTMVSFTQLTNGYLCGLAYEAAPRTATVRYVRNFYKSAKDQIWNEVTSNPDHISTLPEWNSSGNPLPPHLGTGTTDTSFFTLGHLNNRLIAIDNKGEYGAWYSDDFGENWTQYTGLPAGRPLLCVASPFEAVALIGTDSAGLYIYNNNTSMWQQNNNGLSKNLIVRNIAFKETIYKNGNLQKYVYLATNQGIFQSVDGGNNWVLTIPGNYVSVY